MTCSCTQNTSTATATSTSNACCSACANGETCSGSTTTIINPKSVFPITSSDAASNKYSMETEIKSTSGTNQSSIRTGTGTGDTAQEITENVHADLLEVVIDTIRSVIGDTYTSTTITAATAISDGTISAPYLDSLANFQGYFSTGGTLNAVALTDPTLTGKLARLNYITQAFYPVFVAIEKHNVSAETSTAICTTGGNSRVFQNQIKNCLFCFKLIYN